MESLRQKLGVCQTADLLLRCATVVPDEIAILACLGREVDWESLLKLADLHRVTPLLYQNLRGVKDHRIPAEVLRYLRQEYMQNAVRNLLLTDFLASLVSRFSALRVPVLPFKGPTLALMAYPDLALRQIGDLDVLVDRKDYVTAGKLLESLGLVREADYEWESSYVDESGQICIDLHRTMTSRLFPIKFEFQQLFQRRITLNCPSGSFDTLSPEDMLLVLCTQVAKDGYLERCRLHKICDIRELQRSQGDLSLSYVRREAERLGCRRVLEMGLYLSDELLYGRTRVAAAYPSADRYLQTVASSILSGMFGSYENKHEPFNRRLYYTALRERWRDRLLPYIYRVFSPTQLDRAFVKPPFASEPIYYIIRPIRLIRDYGRRLLRKVIP